MDVTSERLAQRLGTEAGANLVARESNGFSALAVDGKAPGLVCSPATLEQVAAALRVCTETAATVIPWGGGTATRIGNSPRQADVVLMTSKLNRIIEHDQANLTVTVQSGVTLATLQETLSRQRQFLPIDAPYPFKATMGGIAAANINGPRRSYYGSIRDLIIGMKVALISGEQIKAGGKVVKNVAGYDMCKLFVGSLGTLGVITEVTVRVAPIPETAATVIASGSFAGAMEFLDTLSHSPLLPAAVVLTNTQIQPGAAAAWQAALWCEGFEETVTRHLSDAEIAARQLGIGAAILRGGNHTELWDSLRDFPLPTQRCVYRATVPRAAVGKFIDSVTQTTNSVPEIVSDVVMGTVWLSWPADSQAAAIWPQLISLATAHRGHAVMFSAPHQLKKNIDVWGTPPSTFSLMRKIKQGFDPRGLLNPGRFVAGI